MRLALAISILLAACGSTPPPDEVTESWTSGDDVALGVSADDNHDTTAPQDK